MTEFYGIPAGTIPGFAERTVIAQPPGLCSRTRPRPGGPPDAAFVVEADGRDIPGADDHGTVVTHDPYTGHVSAFSRPVPSSAGGLPVAVASVPVSRASTSPTVRSRAVGSGSGRCAWTW